MLNSKKIHFIFIVFFHGIKGMLYKKSFKEDLKYEEFWSKIFKYGGKLLYALIPDMHGPLINSTGVIHV
jgi:hypothetical protein